MARVSEGEQYDLYRDGMWIIRPEREEDGGAVETLVRLGFGPGRFAKTTYRLREGVRPDSKLSFVAEKQDGVAEKQDGGELLGSVRFWPIIVGERSTLLLGPLAVRPDLRGIGIGIALMQRGIDEARALGHDSVVLVGDESYYARVGFAKLPPGHVRFPGPVDPARILGLALQPGGLEGLSGAVKRARLDDPVAATAVALG